MLIRSEVQKVEVKMEARFTDVDKRIGEQSTLLGKHTNDIAALTERVNQMEKGGSGKSTSYGGSTSLWQPPCVWVKGFADFANRRTAGVSRPEFQPTYDWLRSKLDPEVAKCVNGFSLDGTRAMKVKVLVTQPDMCTEIVGTWRQALQDEPQAFNGRQLFVTRELSPGEAMRYNAAGRVLSFFEDKKFTDNVRCTWSPNFSIELDNESVCTVSESGAFEWVAATLLRKRT